MELVLSAFNPSLDLLCCHVPSKYQLSRPCLLNQTLNHCHISEQHTHKATRYFTTSLPLLYIVAEHAQSAEAEALANTSNSLTTDPSTSPSTTRARAFSMDKFKAFTNSIGSTVTPFATRSQQWIKEQTGNAGEKTELPHDYVELEVRIDALKQTHQKLLAATSQYANEAYDYPPNVRESFQDLGKSISEKVR